MPAAPIPEVLRRLEAGETTMQVAEACGWPRGRILALINGKPGWLLDADTDRVRQFSSRPRTDEPAAAPQDPVDVLQLGPVVMVPIELIEPHPHNPRRDLGDLDELAGSIGTHGLLQPLLLEPHPTTQGRYRLLIGHRRRAAGHLAGKTELPSVIRPESMSAERAIETMLIENDHREDLNPMDRAKAYGKLAARGLSVPQIVERTRRAESTVRRHLALLDLDEASQGRVRAGELTVGDAVAAVQSTRKKRTLGGRPAKLRMEPPYFADTHRLAKAARERCQAREHTMRPKVGKVACGQCWEVVIKDDAQ
ncbi:ParB/RepB/Spo0J family partition protein [Actinomadura sp. WMMA1423]|uniref:ParB/RepB/Spo0J family partition protein n=1 Tax=Actinomadura sp. WMMA1423 TaxID=2591108 RepID=UPI00143CC2F8|nr:ParB/RepB/Spo0J family partition protein [Actinomadura sp. WMMA1423]